MQAARQYQVAVSTCAAHGAELVHDFQEPSSPEQLTVRQMFVLCLCQNYCCIQNITRALIREHKVPH